MSAKLLITDARQHLIRVRDHWLGKSHEWASISEYAMTSVQARFRSQIKQFVAELSKVIDDTSLWDRSRSAPTKFNGTPETLKTMLERKVDGKVFLFDETFWIVKGAYTDDEAALLILDKVRKQRNKIEYLKRRDTDAPNIQFERQPIPENVRSEVWRRDKARCVQCGSVDKLEFDHLIPVSRGGSNTARNIQLLCERCNRVKSNQI